VGGEAQVEVCVLCISCIATAVNVCIQIEIYGWAGNPRPPLGIQAEILTLFFIRTYIQEYEMNKVILLSLFGFLMNCFCSVPDEN
jgi:hypothetical protein